jgi:hypothetical protein
VNVEPEVPSLLSDAVVDSSASWPPESETSSSVKESPDRSDSGVKGNQWVWVRISPLEEWY